MKIVVTAIAKNEEKNVKPWLETIKDADDILVLDTGSTDKTFTLLVNEKSVSVSREKIEPFRFDVARNRLLSCAAYLDADVALTLDLDDRIEPGWRDKVEKAWKEDTTKLTFSYAHSHNEDGTIKNLFIRDCCHKVGYYRWRYPVHEQLCPLDGVTEKNVYVPDLIVHHWPDMDKPREDYLPLTELSVQETPEDPRPHFQLGIEYFRRMRWEDAESEFLKCAGFSKWPAEIAHSLLQISRIDALRGWRKECMSACQKALEIWPEQRETWCYMAEACWNDGDVLAALVYVRTAMKIKERLPLAFVESRLWNGWPEEFESMCLKALGRKK